MTITLHLKPEVEAALVAQAQATGMVLEDYRLLVVEGAAALSSVVAAYTGSVDQTEAVPRMLEFGEKQRLSFGEAVHRTALHEGNRH